MNELQNIIKDRDKAMKAAVIYDDWEQVKQYAKKYCVPLPEKEEVMKAGIYRAVQEITSMSDDVKLMAKQKCIALGFRPTMW